MSMSAAYHRKSSSGEISDAHTGTKINHIESIEKSSISDPTQPLRDRIAARIVRHLVANIPKDREDELNGRGVETMKCLDVGCALGNDCQTLLSAIELQKDVLPRVEVIGIDIMEAQIEKG